MKKRLLFILCLSFTAAFSVHAQTRTVTNSDLEKFREKRLAAEREYRENYERLGFPSPEELEKQIEQSRTERAALSARLRAESLERERIALEREIAERDAQIRALQYQTENYSQYENGYFPNYAPYGFFNYQNFGYRRNRLNRGFNNNAPRVEYRNNLPVFVRPPQTISVPHTSGGRRN